MRKLACMMIAVLVLICCSGCYNRAEPYALQQDTAQIERIEVIALVDMYTCTAERYVVLAEIGEETMPDFIADFSRLMSYSIINPPFRYLSEIGIKFYYADGSHEIVCEMGAYDSAHDAFDGWCYFDTTEFFSFLQKYGVAVE